MAEQLRNLWKRLCRFFAANPARFASATAAHDTAGLLAVEEEDLARHQRPEPDAGPAGGQR
jgi:hypothetical protein